MADNTFAVRVIVILVLVVILIVLLTQYNKTKKQVVQSEEVSQTTRSPKLERYAEPAPATSQVVMPSSTSSSGSPVDGTTPQQNGTDAPSAINQVLPSEPMSNEDYKAVDFTVSPPPSNDCFPRDKNTVEDLLPKDAANTTWAQVNPAGQGDVKDQNFLNAGFHVGMNTVGQTLRNANYQLRSEPPNPKMQVSPWNQSTIEYDSSRRVFEVGQC